MADARKLAFASFATPAKGVLVLFCEEGVKFGPATRKALAPTGDLVQRAAAADRFTGKSGSSLDIVAPAGLPVGRLAILGVGKAGKLKAQDFVKLGGAAMGKVPVAGRGGRRSSRNLPAARSSPTRRPRSRSARNCAPMCSIATRPSARRARRRRPSRRSPSRSATRRRRRRPGTSRSGPVADGVIMARDLINEPANVLFPEEFARRTARAQEARRRGRGARRAGDEEARHERAARRRAGLAQGQPRRHHALERRQEERRAGRLHRQGRDLRHRRHFDQAGRRHGGHEGRHGGRGLRGRPDACARGAQGQGQRGRRHRPRREHAGRQRPAAGRHRQDDERPDHRDHQHRRRRPPRAGRRAALRQHAPQAALHDRSGDA